MKKHLLSLLLMLMVAIGAVAQSTEVTIGDGTSTGYYLPVNMFYHYSLTQQIYTADEIGMAGTISAISFDYSHSSSFSMSGIKVYMMNTSKSSFASNTDMVALSGATLVYEGVFSASGSGWTTITLDAPFEYEGDENLLICIYDATSGYSGSSYQFKYTNTTEYTSIAYYSDSYTPSLDNVSSFSGNAARYQYHSNIKLDITPAPAPTCPKPAELATSNLTARTVDLAWTAGGEETEWQICLNGNEDNLIVATTNPYTLENLNPETAYTVKVRANCGSEQSRWSNTVSFTTLPSCPVPTELAKSNITARTVDLAWTAGGSETAWQICINNNETELIDVTENPYTLTGLDPVTSYSVKVRANCGDTDGNSQWTSAVQFTTPCEAISSLPYEQSFESTTCPAGCWSIEYAVANPASSNIMKHLTDYAKEGSRSFRFSSFSNTSDYNQYLISPIFDIEGSYVVSFYYRQYSTDEHLYFGTSSTGNAIGDFTWTTDEIPAYSSTWTLYQTVVPAGTKYFAINYNPQACRWYAWIDDVVVREVSTAAEILTYSLPTQLEEATITSGDNAGTIDITVTNSTDLETLAPSYTISEYAEISDPVVTGEGDVRTIEYTVTAEAGNTKHWTVTVTKAPISHDAFITAFTFAGQKEGTTAEIASENDTYIVNAVAEWNVDLSNIAPTVTVSPAATVVPESGVAQDFTADEAVTYTVTAEDGETSHTYTVTIVNDPDACITPATMVVSEITATGATLSWAQAYTETSYRVKVSSTPMTDMTATADAYDGIVNDVELVLTGLAPQTDYFVYLQSDCENAEGWTIEYFTTPCASFSLPYSEDFESYSVNTVADCWDNTMSASTTAVSAPYYVWGVYSYGGNQMIRMYNYLVKSGTAVINMPNIELPANGAYKFSFDYSHKASCGTFAVKISTDGGGTFTQLGSYASSSSGYDYTNPGSFTTETLDLSSYAGNTVIIQFYSNANYGSGAIFIDNITVREISSDAEILDYTFPMQLGDAVINSEDATVTVNASYMADLENLGETVTVSDGAEYVAGATSIEGNVKTFTYTVTAEDGTTTKDWTVTVTKAESASTETDIVAFSFVGQVGESAIDPVEHTVTAYVEWDFDLENNDITPTIEVSPMATISNDGEARNFFGSDETPVQYTVTAEDGTTTQIWNVTIVNDPNVCVNPDDITVENVTSTGATLSWDKRYQEASYIVKVSTVAYESEEELLAATEFVYNDIVALEGDEATLALTDLTPATYYYVYVQSNCENAESWTVTYFGTECDGSAYSVPFVETFDMPSNSVLCWTIIDANEDANEDGQGAWNFDGDQAFYLYNSYSAANDWLISPKIAVVDGAYLTFDYAVDYYYYPEKFSVYVMTDIADYATATVIRETATVTNEEFASIDNIDLSAYAGQEIYIGIKCESEADQDALYIDNFKVILPTYTITATAGENGTIDPESAEVMYGYDKMFTITPAEGYRIATVVVDAETEGEANVTENVVAGDGYYTYTFTNVTANHTIHVTFELIPTYTITATAGENGTITPEGEITVEEGDNQSFTIAANEGYQIASVLVDGEAAELVEGVYTFTNVTANHTIAATFEAIPATTYTITATAGENGTITPAGEITVEEGDNQSFTIAANEGYQIASVMVDGVEAIEDVVEGVYTFENVTANHTIEATFEPTVSVEIIEAGSIATYPNPNNGMFNIDFANIEGTATYQLVDVKGSIIDAQEINVMNGETMQFSYTLTPGAYFVRIISSDNVFVEQIIVR